ncbi:hypothetical protein AgCh_016254 [Apium graveolens]
MPPTKKIDTTEQSITRKADKFALDDSKEKSAGVSYKQMPKNWMVFLKCGPDSWPNQMRGHIRPMCALDPVYRAELYALLGIAAMADPIIPVPSDHSEPSVRGPSSPPRSDPHLVLPPVLAILPHIVMVAPLRAIPLPPDVRSPIRGPPPADSDSTAVNPLEFKGSLDPIEARVWLKEIEKSFALVKETVKTLKGMDVIDWDRFKELFLEKYFPQFVQDQMELKFLELKQGNMSVADYGSKFEELFRFVPSYVDIDRKLRDFSKVLIHGLEGRQRRTRQSSSHWKLAESAKASFTRVSDATRRGTIQGSARVNHTENKPIRINLSGIKQARIEAKTLARITTKHITQFFWENVICRFGIPSILVTDNGRQFDNAEFREYCDNNSIELRFNSVAHPQKNGQAEVANRIILDGLKKMVEHSRNTWMDELLHILWACRTTGKVTTEATTFMLPYGVEAFSDLDKQEISVLTGISTYWKSGSNVISGLKVISELKSRKSNQAAKTEETPKTQTHGRYETIRVPMLRPSEYPIWKVKMAIFLEATDPEYLDRINEGPHKPTKLSVVVADQPAKTIPKEKSEYTAEDISYIAKDANVRHLLHSAFDNVMSNKVIHCKTAKEIWDALEIRCQGTDAIKKNRRTILTQEYENFDSKSDESLTDLYDRFVKLLNDLSLVDKEYDLEDSNLKFLLALPESWDLKATIIRDKYALDETTLDEIYGMLKTYELEMDHRSKRQGRKLRIVALKAEEEFPNMVVSKKGKGKALITKYDSESSSSDDDDSETESLPEGITKIAYRKFRRGKKFSRKSGRSDKKGFRKSEGIEGKCDRGYYSNVKCYNYGKRGHISPDCKKGKSDKCKALVTKKKSWTDTSDSEDEVNYALMANADGSPETAELKGNRRNFLVLDSGCSGHMTGNKALLSDFVEKAGPEVSYGDGNMGKTLGYGNINLGNVIIETVALVSGLKHNLLSISQIYDRGYHVDFFEEHCEVISNSAGKVVLKGYRHGNIYETRLSTSTDGSTICLLSRASIEESWNWHKKLSHLNFNNINELVKKDLVRGFPKSFFAPDGLCDSCQKAKQRKSSFKSKTESSILEPYHLLHVDLFGPVNVMSITKKKYDMVIVDEFTRYTWVYFLHKKNETAFTLTDHVRELDKLVKDYFKIIMSDNGTEFKNSIMEEFFKEHGIKQEFSAPGTPQQNGVVERKNKTLIEAARTMLDEAKLPTYFWAEAVLTACFTQNATLINKHGKTPYEMVKKKKPNMKYFHVFGCKCFILKTHPEQLSKFDLKADEGIFVG